ncbi:hypothetical protein CLV33_10170 [Jejuia pallidilutea]|uniref:Uncharacterized protein n=1 Tax=Jejuia pallidilutea TaxID=504487 RepID=A0A362XD51_9FLAO|nr:hypothetical protein [Jejuia pallidilutea]PQV51150.1 hypothetical protein CLV33_10170 [Jejuia pallidilutea]
MELVVPTLNLKSESMSKEDFISQHSGFLNSQYKVVVSESFKETTSKTIFGIRRHIKNSRYQLTTGAEVALKVVLFVVIIISIFN